MAGRVVRDDRAVSFHGEKVMGRIKQMNTHRTRVYGYLAAMLIIGVIVLVYGFVMAAKV